MAVETKRDVEEKYLAVRPSRPFGLEVSFLGDGRRTPVTCAGAGFGFAAAEDQPLVGPDNKVTLTAEELAAGLFGIVQLRGENPELPPIEICIRQEDIAVFRALLKQLDQALGETKRDAWKSVQTLQAVPAPDFTGRVDGEREH